MQDFSHQQYKQTFSPARQQLWVYQCSWVFGFLFERWDIKESLFGGFILQWRERLKVNVCLSQQNVLDLDYWQGASPRHEKGRTHGHPKNETYWMHNWNDIPTNERQQLNHEHEGWDPTILFEICDLCVFRAGLRIPITSVVTCLCIVSPVYLLGNGRLLVSSISHVHLQSTV